MKKTDHELITDAVRLTCPLNEHDGLHMLCHSDPTPTNCVRTCSKVGEFWAAFRQLKTKEIEL